MIPVSIRTGEEERALDQPGVGDLRLAARPTSADPSSGCARVHEAMVDAKELFDAVPAETLTDFTQFPPPGRVRPGHAHGDPPRPAGSASPVNLVISNVPGPREPLYAAGAELLHYYPVSTIVDGQGLNITVQSYLDTLDFGLVGCRELVPDLWDMVDAIVDDLAVLGKAVGVEV